MKERFYVFLDIDGTLWDRHFLREKKNYYISLNPESVSALEVLLESIKNKYNLEFVITSRRRLDWWECMDFLQFNGFDVYKYNPNRTQVDRVQTPRGVKIAEYMFNCEKGIDQTKPKHFSKLFMKRKTKKVTAQLSNNFVVLDDDMKPLRDYIPRENIIRTDNQNRSLDLEMVEEFLKSRGIEVVKKESEEEVTIQEKKTEEKTKIKTKKEVKEIEHEPELGEE